MPLILPGNVGSATAATTFSVANSCMFNGSNSVMSVDTGSASTNKVTISAWVKKSAIATDQWVVTSYRDNNNRAKFGFGGGDTLSYFMTEGGTDTEWNTTALFRDPSAWYHILLQADNTQGTFANRAKLYVNGVVMATSSSGSSTLNSATAIIGNGTTAVGDSFYGSAFQGNTVDGYLAEVVLVQGSILAPTAFGEFNADSGVWSAIDITDTVTGIADYSFYLDFEDSSNLGNNASDSGLADLTEANLAAIDQKTDTCTNNFATLNPLVPSQGGFTPGSATYTEGNTIFTTVNASSSYSRANATILLTAGKWYTEIKYVNAGSIYGLIGITGSNATTTAAYPGVYAYDYAWYGNGGFSSGDGNFYNNNGIVRELGSGFDNNDILGMAIDLDNNTIQYYRAGSAVGSANAIAAPSATDFGGYVVCASEWSNSSNAVFNFNFGNPPYANSSSVTDGEGFGNFEYAPPSGFLAICSKNLAEYG